MVDILVDVYVKFPKSFHVKFQVDLQVMYCSIPNFRLEFQVNCLKIPSEFHVDFHLNFCVNFPEDFYVKFLVKFYINFHVYFFAGAQDIFIRFLLWICWFILPTLLVFDKQDIKYCWSLFVTCREQDWSRRQLLIRSYQSQYNGVERD